MNTHIIKLNILLQAPKASQRMSVIMYTTPFLSCSHNLLFGAQSESPCADLHQKRSGKKGALKIEKGHRCSTAKRDRAARTRARALPRIKREKMRELAKTLFLSLVTREISSDLSRSLFLVLHRSRSFFSPFSPPSSDALSEESPRASREASRAIRNSFARRPKARARAPFISLAA